jgi:histidine kinase
LAQASKLATIGEMSTGIAHELNQPLSVIKSASTFLRFLAKKVIEKETPQPGESNAVVTIQADALKSLTDEIDSHVDRASRIIRHLRDFGRQSDLSRERVDLNEAIRRAFMLMGTQLQTRGISYHLQLEETLPLIMADMSRLEQVFINLILNARDAIQEMDRDRKGIREEGGISVRTFLDGDRVAVAFRDTGCGIPREILGKIFDPFFTTKKAGEGTGLGLSISYGIVQDYGGKIQVWSVVGTGTIFTLWFPAAPPAG